ncbi:MAG TPA: hypothetical protein VGP36_10160 [Mycobacteriales bacterium]|jgi:hypothetical protein|nr:hypothetical protein [Mycobacteriales bacterium]
MGLGSSVRDAVKATRESRGGQLGVGGALVVAIGVLLGWLASRRSAVPPVRATGVAANLPRDSTTE